MGSTSVREEENKALQENDETRIQILEEEMNESETTTKLDDFQPEQEQRRKIEHSREEKQ